MTRGHRTLQRVGLQCRTGKKKTAVYASVWITGSITYSPKRRLTHSRASIAASTRCLDPSNTVRLISDLDFTRWPMDPRDANKTTFVCYRGIFRFPKMPFRLCNAPATFQRLMDTVLTGLNYQICLAYLGDIILYSHDLELERRTVAYQTSRSQSQAKALKVSDVAETSALSGVSQDGVGTDPDKIAAIRDWPMPQNLRQSRAFIGLCQYYRRSVPNFSELPVPLHVLRKMFASIGQQTVRMLS